MFSTHKAEMLWPRLLLLAAVAVGCTGGFGLTAPTDPTDPTLPTPTETLIPTPRQWFQPTSTPTAAVTRVLTPTTPPREIVLTAPQEGNTVASPIEVEGRVSVMPFEANLRGRVYDAEGRVVGEKPIQAQPNTEDELGGPGTFSGSIPFQIEQEMLGRVEIAEISARDGSVVAWATVSVTLTTDESAATH